MDSLKNFCVRYVPYIGGGLLTLGATVLICKKIRARKARVCGVDYPADTVILHQFAKGVYAPSFGHFCVKLETYLKMAKIPYKIHYDRKMGPKGKAPWIEYNGQAMGDSQLIINFLNKEFRVDLNKHLSSQERATAWAIQKWLEEFTYWLNVHIRWVILFDDFYDRFFGYPAYLKWSVKKRMKEMTYRVGIGRHTDAEVYGMMMHDLTMLSELLGDKKFLMGDQPTELDCAAFGILSQIKWQTPDACPGKCLMKEKLNNLMNYCDRIKAIYWPDWDEKITGKPRASE